MMSHVRVKTKAPLRTMGGGGWVTLIEGIEGTMIDQFDSPYGTLALIAFDLGAVEGQLVAGPCLTVPLGDIEITPGDFAPKPGEMGHPIQPGQPDPEHDGRGGE